MYAARRYRVHYSFLQRLIGTNKAAVDSIRTSNQVSEGRNFRIIAVSGFPRVDAAFDCGVDIT